MLSGRTLRSCSSVSISSRGQCLSGLNQSSITSKALIPVARNVTLPTRWFSTADPSAKKPSLLEVWKELQAKKAAEKSKSPDQDSSHYQPREPVRRRREESETVAEDSPFGESRSRGPPPEERRVFPSSASRHLDSTPTSDPFEGHSADPINYEKYQDIPVTVTGEHVPEPIKGFADLHFGPELLRNIQRANYTKPIPVQCHSMPIINAGRDLMSCAQTGSGKTAAFLLPIINSLLAKHKTYTSPAHHDPYRRRPGQPQALIIVPTRELGMQIHTEARKFTFGTHLKTAVIYGGTDFLRQIQDLGAQPGIVVGTPGRLWDHMQRGTLNMHNLEYLVLDEADRMLDMGFEPQIRAIVESNTMPSTEKRQTLMFSATFPEEIQSMAATFLKTDYIFISVGRVGGATNTVTQKFELVNSDADKEAVVFELLNRYPGKTLIFTETKKRADILEITLKGRGINAMALHGDLNQVQRNYTIQSFTNGQCPVLVATNVAARGLDIKDIKHVINYDMPNDVDDYVHRIGRTGRAGKTGVSTSILTPNYLSGRSANDLLKILKDSKQEIPDWIHTGGSFSGGGNAPRYQRGRTSSDHDGPRARNSTDMYDTRDRQDRNDRQDRYDRDRRRR